jgi:UDP-GlcNAc:undecaprenyl-phosphate GlcNAc-1-phosphate transferase
MQPQAVLRHLAFVAGLALLSAATVRLMIAARLMDTPDARKAHMRPTPKGGGVGIVLAFLVGVVVLYQYAAFARLADPYFRGVMLAAAAIALVALLDDLRDWPFFVKLAAQVAAALAAVGSGLSISVFSVPYVGPVDIGWLGPPLAVAWILFCTNAMNFIDGLDGLAGGVTLIAACFLAGIAAEQGGWFVYFASLLLVAGAAGFLPFNFPRARIFMGDVGSQFCGFVLAVLGIAAARFGGVDLSFLIVPMLLAGVLFDVAFTLARRAVQGEPLTKPHRGHLYQIAHRAGMPARAIALVHWGFAATGGLACIWFVSAPSEAKAVIPFATLLPQVAWLAYVMARARRAGIAV